ncbi:radical SAM protein [Candidatus Woesearchaeota archaeon]|nr:radical SAM protein [Candidatus Woesearchaeota archaeon]
MAALTFENLEFLEKENEIVVNFMKYFYFKIEKEELERIADFKISKNSIYFENISEKSASNKFNILLSKKITGLKSKISGNRTIYIHKNSGIPLIGSNSFGLVDRGTSLIEIKPITGCNLGCIFCSVNEGIGTNKAVDFVVEKDYIVEEFRKLAAFKGIGDIEAHINAQGEPLLYSNLADLIKDLRKIKEVGVISIDTNGVLLNKKLVDELADAGLTRFNLSLVALDKELAKKLAGTIYDVEKIKEIARYIAKKSSLLIAPVLVPGINDDEIAKLIGFCKEINSKIGLQNFLNYRYGRNPVKAIPMDIFRKKLMELESEYSIRLLLTKDDFNIRETKKLPKPFKKGQIIKAKIMCESRRKSEKIAVADERCITVPNCSQESGIVKLRITRDKDNVFYGEQV